MSDARKMNRAITDYLKQMLQGSVRDSHIFALAMMITGLIRSKSSHFEHIGAKSGATAKYGSRVKQIHRFIKNDHVTYESHYLPFIELVIASLGLTEFRLSIDSSQVGRNCLMLIIGLVYKKRVIPLVWLVYKGKKGHSSTHKQIELLTQVRDLLPEGARVIVTGDAEFDGTEVVTWLKAQPNWDYACRTAKNILVRASQDAAWQALQELAPPPGENRLLSQVYFTQQEVGPVNIAFLWNETMVEHLYLVTSAQTLQEAQTWYRRRFQIETLFADAKSRGFGLDKSGIRDPHRLARFVIAVFLAYIWMIYLGVLVIQEQRLDLIARTDRFMHSLFRLGCLYLDRILEEGWQIPVSFRLPDPRSFVHFVLV
jgi:hypothetical protein